MPSAFLLYGEHCLTQVSLFFSDLVNGLVALMNSNVSSPVNLVSIVLPLCTSCRVFGEGFPCSRLGHLLSTEVKQSRERD